MKKLSSIIMVIALVLGLTQCMKQDIPSTLDDDDGMVYITVKVDDNGEGHIVFPEYGQFAFDEGDILYVGNNGHYIGYLRYFNDAGDHCFEGCINPANTSTSDKLHFYFLGGKGPDTSGLTNETTSFDINIADQTIKLPILCYGVSTQNWSNANTAYSTTLSSQCALVKFDLTQTTSYAVTVAGLLTEATVNLATASINPKETTGAITLHNSTSGESNERWAVLLPGTTFDGANNVTVDESVPAIANNSYITGGITIDNHPIFSVGNNTTVQFAPGNLQYQASSQTWRFAENQWDYVGNASNNNTMSPNSTNWVDLFGWGTWGEGKDPLNSSLDDDNYKWSTDFQDTIDDHDDWRTLTQDEWVYLFNNEARGAIRYLKANISVGNDSYNGVIVFPDNYDGSIGTYTDYNNTTWWASVNAADWSVMESAGAVFLPVAGSREELRFFDNEGVYWSASPYEEYWGANEEEKACALSFCLEEYYGGWLEPDYSKYRSTGASVRLVRNLQ